MFPTIELFGKTLGTYALCALVGILCAGFCAARLCEKRGETDADAVAVGLFALIGTLIGGHILYAITNLDTLIKLFGALDRISAKSFFELFWDQIGGMVFFGGLYGGILAAYLYVRKKKLPLGVYGDAYAVALPLFHFFGRIGCFLGGCCYGVESAFGFTMHSAPFAPANGVNRFPVQLLESACNFALFVILLILYKKEKAKGKLLPVYLAGYSVIRFSDEFLRGDEIRGHLWIFSTSQWIALITLLVLGLVFGVRKLRRRKEV